MAGQSRSRLRASEFRPNEHESVNGDGQDSASSLKLNALLNAVWRRKVTFMIPVALCMAAGLAYSVLATPNYEATATLLVKDQGAALEPGTPYLRREDEFLATQAEVINSHAVISKAVADLKLPPPADPTEDPITLIRESLSVSPLRDTDVLEVRLWNPDPAESKRILDAILKNYRDFLKQDDQDEYRKTLSVLTDGEKQIRAELREKNGELLKLRENSPLIGTETDPAAVQHALLTKLGHAVIDAKNRRIQLENQLISFQENEPQVAEELLRLTKTELPQTDEQIENPVGIQVTLLVDLGEAMIDAKNRRIELENQIEQFRALAKEAKSGEISPAAVAALRNAGGRSRNARTESTSSSLIVSGRNSGADGQLSLVNIEEPGDVRLALFEAQAREKEVAQKYGERHPLRKAAQEQVQAWRDRLSETTNAAYQNLEGEYETILVHLEREFQGVIKQEASLTKAYDADFLKAKVAVLDHVRKEKNAVAQQEERLLEAYDEDFATAKEVDAFLVKETLVRDDITRLKTIHDSMLTQLKQWELTSETIASGRSEIKVTVLEPPVIPESPAWPLAGIILGVCGLFGSFGGLGLVTLAEKRDKRVHTVLDVQARFPTPVVGEIPQMSGSRSNYVGRGRLAHDMPNAAFSEAFRNLRTILENSFGDDHGQVVQLASPLHDEGKTTVTSNLAFSFAQLGRKVAVVDADLRRGQLHQIFGVSNKAGLSNAVLDNRPIEELMQRSPLAAIDVLSKGADVDNPSEVLGQEKFAQTLKALRENYDVILVDTPALLEVSDGSVVAPHADQVLVSVVLGESYESLIARSNELLESLGANVSGMVVNGVALDARRTGYYQMNGSKKAADDVASQEKSNVTAS